MAIGKDPPDHLPAGRDPQDMFAKDGLVGELKTALTEWTCPTFMKSV